MRSIAVFALASLLFAAPALAHADATSKHAKIEEMLRITKMDDVIGKVMDQTKGEIQDLVDEQRASANNMPPDQAEIMNKFEAQVSNLVMGVLKIEDVHPLMVKLYDETYTEEELDGILAFYKTPAGQALLSKTSDLMDKIMGVVQQRVTGLAPEVDKLTEDMQKKMVAAQHGGGAAAPAPAPAPGSASPAPAPKP